MNTKMFALKIKAYVEYSAQKQRLDKVRQEVLLFTFEIDTFCTF